MIGLKLIFALSVLSCLHYVDAMEGIVETLSGGGYPHVGEETSCVDGMFSKDGNILEARFSYPWGILYDQKNEAVYVADCGCPQSSLKNDVVRKIDLVSNLVTSIAGSRQGYRDGKGNAAQFKQIAGMALDSEDQIIYVADSGNDVIRTINIFTTEVKTYAGMQEVGGFVDGLVKDARFFNPQQLEWSKDMKALFVSDTDNHAIRMIKRHGSKKIVSTITGGPDKLGFLDGKLQEAKWHHPTGIAYDLKRHVLYVSDHYNHAVRKIDLKDEKVLTIAGDGKAGKFVSASLAMNAKLNYPEGLALDVEEDVLYFAEFSNNCIRMITLIDNNVHLLAGGEYGTRDAVGRYAQFYHPTSLDFDPGRKVVYVTDQYNHRIRTVTTLGNTQVGHPNLMIMRHMGHLDAYRDLTIHNRFALKLSSFVIIFMVLLLLFLKLKFKNLKNFEMALRNFWTNGRSKRL